MALIDRLPIIRSDPRTVSRVIGASRTSRIDLAVILLLAVAPVVAYAPAWGGGRLLAPGAGAALHLPLRAEVWRAWDRGDVPSWNGSSFSGDGGAALRRMGQVYAEIFGVAEPIAR